jgi:N-acetylneuraminate lyase/4-hydroxy-tetrahydrodipicolinate synthase
MSKKKIYGVMPAPIIPFTKDGEVDEKKLREYIKWLVDKKVHSLYPLGSFGAGPLMNVEERKRCAEIIAEAVDGRIPIICHIGAQNTRDSVYLAKHAESIGMDGVASVPPGYYKHVPETIKAYYQELINAVSVPVYLYNFPAAVGYGIAPDLLAELAEMGLAGVKDSSLDLVYFTRAMNAVKKPDFVWISGTVPLMFPAVMMGAVACVAGTANSFPEFTISLWDAIQAKEYEKAAEIQKKVTRLVDLQAMTIPVVGVHEMLRLRGLDFGYPRPPLKLFTEAQRTKMKESLIELGLL